MKKRFFNFIDKYIWLIMIAIFLILTVFIYFFWDLFWNHILIWVLLYFIFSSFGIGGLDEWKKDHGLK